jgi:hypothetical protein
MKYNSFRFLTFFYVTNMGILGGYKNNDVEFCASHYLIDYIDLERVSI